MSIKIAINGFGRIGRLTLRAIIERTNEPIQIIAINDLTDIDSIFHLLKYDSVHQKFEGNLKRIDNSLIIEDKEVKIFSTSDPAKLPWGKLNVDLVIESTGIFTEKIKASKHLEAGAKKVLISAPSSDADITVVYGVNHKDINLGQHKIISNGSCTTNCLAPLVKILNDSFGIETGYMTTVHSVTGDQNTIDTFHKDLRRSRNASLSMIPTSTGAARAVGKVLPVMIGKLDGSAIRVPTANVSLIDFCFTSKVKTSVEDINTKFLEMSETTFNGIIDVEKDPLVSSDFNHNMHSAIVDCLETKVVNNKFCRILAWYDNEWGFSNRLLDVAKCLF